MSAFKGLACLILLVTTSSQISAEQKTPLTLQQAVAQAIQKDPWLEGSQYRENATISSSIAADTLPDPVVSLGLANVPTDGFAFDQEPMTQIKAGISQMFPRGESLSIRRKQLEELATQHPFMRLDRIAKTQVAVSMKWLDVYLAQQSISLIEKDRSLFEQLSEIAEANYSSAVGKVRQQDIIRAQLELARLEDRLTKLSSQKERASAELLEWLTGGDSGAFNNSVNVASLELPKTLPEIEGIENAYYKILKANNQQMLANILISHPLIRAVESRIKSSQTGIKLAKQQYKPQWGVNASYAYRADDQMDRSRADFLSIGVSFDLPLFTENKQDKEVSAAVNESEAIKTEKRLVLRGMLAQMQSIFAARERLLERQTLYRTNILQQSSEQAEASLTAYTNDDGDFAEVVRARIADLNARIDALEIEVELLKTNIQLNYFFSEQSLKAVSEFGANQ
ncbi:outer membrane protein TolC [Alteromonas sp. 76-1]|jgi:outer membrane protein TolC|uniref:TolC family protein n=1 Tax=Alteromonas TaxID=226 RepID=UPI0005097ABA|nr:MULTISPECIES: TolC family protein [unclassified Alteromonas]VEL97211.1 outer membrane protein TolC [Alteromonas sp. 76-1]